MPLLQCAHSVLYSLFNQYSMFDNSVFPFYLIIHTVDSVYMMSQDGKVNRVPAGLMSELQLPQQNPILTKTVLILVHYMNVIVE